ncbi:MAG: class I SAM-dependent methyltransferase [Lentisphaeria bacterium]|nr:class I SAM-dependent methyltransferase [Lentisphaeria bacterium]
MQEKKSIHYNPYEGTNIVLIEKLIKSGVISPEDHIADIGCGAGIFLLYLASRGFYNLSGYEIDQTLYEQGQKNIESFYSKRKDSSNKIELLNVDAVNTEYPSDITCFYLFNTFYDKDTYLSWIKKVYSSWRDNQRKIKIIILFPTVASMGALRECNWLRETGRVIDKSHPCWRCVNFLVYETIDEKDSQIPV